MIRGLPYSILVHLVALALVIFYGNAVHRQVINPPRSIQVRMVQLPSQAQESPPESREEVEPEVTPPAPEVKETVTPRPAKEVPEAKPQPRPVQEEPEPRPETKTEQEQEPEPATSQDPPAEQAQVETPVISGPAVAGTDVDFPFAWYLARVQGQIARNWQPKQLGFRSRTVVSCLVHFTINKNGSVSQVTLTRPSGVGVFDREALRVVQSSRIPPLPPGFASSSLGVSMEFNLESGI